ncbi:hypothetical protein AG4045_025309, partial [Apium graveolens]
MVFCMFSSVSHRTGDSNKVNNSVPSSPSTLENEKKLETLKAGSLSASECRRSDMNQKVDDKVDDKLELAHPVLENKVAQKATTLTAVGGHEEIDHSK